MIYVPKKFGPKIFISIKCQIQTFFSPKNIDPKKSFVQKHVVEESFFSPNIWPIILNQKTFWTKKIIFGPTFFWVHIILGQKFFESKETLSQQNFGSKEIQSLQKIGSKKFGQNWVSNSWDIPDMDKCCQDKCCLDKCHCDSWNLFKMVPGTFL